MAINVAFDQVFENVMMNAIIAACDGNGVLDGLAVSENSAGADLSVDVAGGSSWINGTKYTESTTTINLHIGAPDATYDRKDILVGIPYYPGAQKITGTAAATPIPPDIPAGDILLAIVNVAAGATAITNADITDGRVIVNSERTRHIFLHTPIYTTGAFGATSYGIELDDTTPEKVEYMFAIPNDFISIGNVYVYYKTANDTNDFVLSLECYYRTLDEAMNANVDFDSNNVITAVDTTMKRFTTSGLLASATVGDNGMITIERSADDTNDTLVGDLTIVGVLIEYTAGV